MIETQEPFDPTRLDAVWDRYISAISRSEQDFQSRLEAGASDGDIADLEGTIEVKLPPELRHLLKRHNGAAGFSLFPNNWEFCSTKAIAAEWKIWAEIYHTRLKPGGFGCNPEPGIRSDEWWRPTWVPFCSDGGGNHLCVDLEPAPEGHFGQIITMWHDTDSRAVLAADLTQYIEQVVGQFEAGQFRWDEEYGGIYDIDDI